VPARDPVERRLIASMAVSERWARTSRAERQEQLAKVTAASLARFERQVDPDGVLDPEERAFRAEQAKRAYYTRLVLRSVQARRRKSTGR